MKEHIDFLKSLYTFCLDRGYVIQKGATVKEQKKTVNGKIIKRTVIEFKITVMGEKN